MSQHTNPITGTKTTTSSSNVPLTSTTGFVEKVQPQPYPLQGQALATGWGQYPQGAYYPPPVQKPQEFREEVPMASTTSTTTTQYVEVAPVTTSTTYMTAPISTGSTYVSTAPLARSVIGPNTHGVPENFPWLASDASCHKCHGTGYKKKMLTRRWAPCKKCAKKYGTDVHRVDLKNLPPITTTSQECVCPISTTMIGTMPATTIMPQTTMIGTMPATTSTSIPNTVMMGTMPATTMVGSTIAGTRPATTSVTYSTASSGLPSGFQTLPANPACVKCQGTGYRRSRKASNWKGCKTCAKQYGTNLHTVIIPSTANTMVTTGTSATGTSMTGTNILY